MANYILLERITVGSAGASSVTFNNIPQTGYTDLKLVVSGRTTRSANGDDIKISLNGSSSNFTEKFLYGNGATPYSITGTQLAGIVNAASDTNNTFSNLEFYFPNYTSSNYKSFSIDSVNENNGTTAFAGLSANLWSNTAAITSITLQSNNSGSWVQYSTFSLYALAAVGTTPTKAPKAIGGDIIQTDGTYWYHAFLSSGSFTPQTALSCDVLVVAGGGGGGANSSGGAGGGAGGVFAATAQALTANTTNLITVGAGGSGAGSSGANGAAGSNSTFASLTAAVGGGYGGGNGAGGSGGSGGGAGRSAGASGGSSTQTGTGGTGYGNAGGNAINDVNNQAGGGGGGAGGAGGAANGASTGGAGGAGLNTWSSWLSATGLGVSGYIAGGGGGSGYYTTSPGTTSNAGVGTAGGGTMAAGTPNTGGGGAGGGGSSGGGGYTAGYSGGSGLVIVRYAY